MRCEELNELLPDYWSGALNETAKSEMQAHLAVCTRCHEEFERLGTVWRRLGAIPEERPSAALRTRFEATVEAYEQGMRRNAATLARELK